MNDLFLKFIEKLGSIDNTFLFALSIIPYAIFLFYLYKIKSINNFVNNKDGKYPFNDRRDMN